MSWSSSHGGADEFLKAWCESRAHFVTPTRRQNDRAAAAVAGTNPVQRQPPRPSPEEISQRSVDLLLTEYYKMVKSSQAAPPSTVENPGMVDRLFLAVCCPPLSPFAAIGAVLRLVAALVSFAAYTLVYLSWLLVPVGLGLLWTLYQQGRQQEASVAAGIALVALLLADGLVRAAAWSRNQAIEGAVTAANVKELLPANGASVAARFFPAATKAAAAAAAAAPATQAKHSGVAANQRPAASSSSSITAVPGGSVGEDAGYAELLPGLESLQRVVFGAVSDNGGASARERLAAGLQRIGSTLGYTVSPAMLENSAAMARTMAELRRHLGCA